MKVYVAVNLDLGWDNVVGVFDSMEKAEAACRPTQEELDSADGDWYRERISEYTGIYELHHIHVKDVQ